MLRVILFILTITHLCKTEISCDKNKVIRKNPFSCHITTIGTIEKNCNKIADDNTPDSTCYNKIINTKWCEVYTNCRLIQKSNDNSIDNINIKTNINSNNTNTTYNTTGLTIAICVIIVGIITVVSIIIFFKKRRSTTINLTGK